MPRLKTILLKEKVYYVEGQSLKNFRKVWIRPCTFSKSNLSVGSNIM